MKYLASRAGHSLSSGALLFLGCAISSSALSIAPATAQVANAQAANEQKLASANLVVTPAISALPILQATPQILNSSGKFTLSLPPNSLATTRVRVAVSLVNRTETLADLRRDFVLQNGVSSTQITLDAPPGDYGIRLLRDDKTRAPLTQKVRVTIAGIRREPGWWLFDGSSFVTSIRPEQEKIDANARLFIAGLKRDFPKKAKPISRNIPANARLPFRVLDLPSLGEMSAPNYDFAALNSKIVAQIAEARAGNLRNFVGFVLPIGDEKTEISVADSTRIVAQVRQIINVVAPEAALICRISSQSSPAQLQILQTLAPLCDAAILQSANATSANAIKTGTENDVLWTLKNLRRIAEDQTNYDLPIFVDAPENAILPLWMSGAAGFVSDFEYSNAAQIVAKTVIERNLPLFIGSVTLEDIGVAGAKAAPLFGNLADAGRIPLAARLPDLSQKESARTIESVMFAADEKISDATIERLRAAATAGARITIIGAPMQDENGVATAWKLSSLVGAEIKSVTPKTVSMNLQDGWMFGTARGTKLQVAQNFVVTLGNGTVAARAKVERGLDILTKPRAAALLDDGTPALVINPVGKGEVVWLPFRVLENDDAKRRHFYAALSNYIEPALVTLRATDLQSDSRDLTRAALRPMLRRSAKGALILALFNDSARDTKVTATIRGVAGVALDLNRERELPFTTRGNETEVNASIPAHSFALIAFATTRKALDDERAATSLKMRLK